MNKVILISISLISFVFAFDFGKITSDLLSKVPSSKDSTTSALSSLSEETVSKGLKVALKKGSSYAIETLGKKDGFFNNSKVKIPLPEKLGKVESLMRKAGASQMADDLIISMNKSASQASLKTAKIFISSIDKMTLNDAKKILAGNDNEASKFFEKNSSEDLKKVIKPIVQNLMKENQVVSYYNKLNSFYENNLKETVNNSSIMSYAKKAGLDSYMNTSNLNLEDYVTEKTISGLFIIIQEKEKQIRNNPLEQTSLNK